MKHRFVLFSLFLCCLGLSSLRAQTTQANIISALQSNDLEGNGSIKIVSDPKIAALIGKPSGNNADNGQSIKINGYRIQVFMGNNPKTAKGEAEQKESLIKASFPEITSEIKYVAPNWKVLAGDFMTKDEADVFKQKLQKAFPAFGKEMYIVSDKISIYQ
jgi:hypothetical protein